MSTIEAIRANIDDARQSLQAQVDDLTRQIEALTEASNWLGIATGDPEVNAPVPEAEAPVQVMRDPHAPKVKAEPPTERKGGAKATVDYDAIAEWIKAAKAAGTYSQTVLAQHFNVPLTTAKNWITGCKKRGLLDGPTVAAEKPAEPVAPARGLVDLDAARALL